VEVRPRRRPPLVPRRQPLPHDPRLRVVVRVRSMDNRINKRDQLAFGPPGCIALLAN
jgi:hypothetical protein